MHRISFWERSRTYKATKALTEVPFLPILLPCFPHVSSPPRHYGGSRSTSYYRQQRSAAVDVERYFLSALDRAGSSHTQRHQESPKTVFTQEKDCASNGRSQRRSYSALRGAKEPPKTTPAKSVTSLKKPETAPSSEGRRSSSQPKHEDWPGINMRGGDSSFRPFYEVVDYGIGPVEQDLGPTKSNGQERKAKLQAELNALENTKSGHATDQTVYEELQNLIQSEIPKDPAGDARQEESSEPTEQDLVEQIRYLRMVRELEKKLESARQNLHKSMQKRNKKYKGTYWQEETYQDQGRIEIMDLTEVEMIPPSRPTVEMKKEDFLGLVDLYFYSHRTRFLSESPDASPTPLQLDDYSFKVSKDFSPPTNADTDLVRDEEGTPVSPLYHVEAEIKTRKMNEVKALQNFVDLLLDDYSPLRDLFRAYKALPQPGVSYLSGGVIRLFLQRMSTPWRTSEKAMLRYLSLLDDMQLAGLPITAWEWNSAIYLAGQSFNNVSNTDVTAAFSVWRQMEKNAGVASRAVTFNILFDIAVKAEKFVLAEEILKEMHERGFRLNRLGRVALIYYYGKKGDGDGVRKAYRDFVEAGEIVDTLVLNCVMASLINAQEPAAAEQIYERMKGMQERLRRGTNADGEDGLFLKYPPPGPDKLGTEMASNALGRVLLNASRLKTTLPEHHAELQNVMPLTPDAITYRTLMSYHVKTSGNIDRLTVLLDDMTRNFRIPITDMTFQFLFKGFAMHGGSDRSDAKWTQQRLQIAWAACLACMRAGKTKEASTSPKAARLDLPSVNDAEAMAADDEKRANEEASRRPKPRRPNAWDTFIKQFVTPYPETKPFNLYSTSLDASDPPAEEETGTGEEYQLPRVDLKPKSTSDEDRADISPVHPNKNLALWAIRAFTRCTASRSVLEDVWYQLKRIWRPWDFNEKAVAIRELRRALRYCDTHGGK